MVPFRFPDPDSRSRLRSFTWRACRSVTRRPPGSDEPYLRIDDDDRIALLGVNGNGKSTFAKLVANALQPETGSIVRASKLKIGLFAQHQIEALNPEHSAYDHVRALLPDAPEAKVRSRTAQMGLTTEKMATEAANLSGGEKARLMMGLTASGAGNPANDLDEPTNHLDIDSREALGARPERLFRRRDPCWPTTAT